MTPTCTKNELCLEKRIATLLHNLHDPLFVDHEICRIGDEWLAICSEIFTEDHGFDINNNGDVYFVPSLLKVNVSTESLAQLIDLADSLDIYEETIGMTCENDYKLSLLTHLNRRASKSDTLASRYLTKRATDKLKIEN